MRVADKTKEQLVEELESLHSRIAELEKTAAERKEIEEAIRNLEEEKLVILNTVSEQVVYQNSQHRILWANEIAAQSTGLTREQLVGCYCYETWPQRNKPCVGCPAVKARESGKLQEGKITAPDGRVWFIQAYPIRDTNHHVAGIVEVLSEITESKQTQDALQEEKNKLQSIVDALEYGLSIQDTEYNIIYQNEPSKKATGDFVGQKCYRAYGGQEKICDGCPVEKAFKDGKPHTSERSRVTPSGKLQFWENTANPVRDARGKIVACLEITREMTERRQVDEKIQQQNEFLSDILDSLTHPFYVLDTNDYKIKLANRAAEHDDLSANKTCYSLTHNRDKPCAGAEHVCPLEEVKKTKKPVVVEHIHYDGDGNARNIEVHGYPIFDSEGNVAQMIEYCLDITERKRMEEALRDSEEKFSKVFSSSANAICITSLKDSKFIEINESFTRFTGYTREEVIGHSTAELDLWVKKEELERWLNKLQEQGGKAYNEEFHSRMKSGEIRIALASAETLNIGGEPCRITMIADITERKRAEEKLKESEGKYKTLAEDVPIGIYFNDFTGKFLYGNKKAAEIVGYQPRELIGKSFLKLKLLDSKGLAKAAKLLALNKMGKATGPDEFVLSRKDGTKRTVEIRTRITRVGGRKVVLGMAEDITERKRAEEALADEVNRRRILVEQSLDGIVVLDEDARVYEANQRFAEMLGYTLEEVHKLHTWDWDKNFPPEQLLEMGRNVDESGLQLETQHHRKDGSVIDVEISISGSVIAGKKLIFCVCRDITERKRAEEALQAEKNKVESVIDAMEDGLTIQNKDYNIIYQNETLKKLFGDRLGEKCYRVYEGRDKLCDGCPLEKAFKDGKSHTSERKVVMPSGEVNFWENTANPIRNAEGKIVSCLEIARNITERKQAEDALKESQKFGSSLLESSPNQIFVLNPDTSVKYVNPAFEKLTGFTLAEITGKKAPYPWWPEEERKEMIAQLKNAMVTGGRKSERVFQKKNGERFWVALNSAPIMHNGKLVHFLINWVDITERKQAQQKFENLVESTSDMIWETDVKGTFTFVSPKIKDILGYDANEIVGKMKTLEFIPKEEAQKWLERFKELNAKQKPFSGFEITHLHKNGNPLVFEISGAPCFDSAGNFKGFIGVNKDITERKRAEEEMQKMFESVTDGIIVVDLNGAITEANQRTVEMHGFKSKDDLLGRNALDLVAPSDHNKIAANMRQALKQGTIRGMEYTMLRTDGSEFPAELNTSVIKDVSGKPIGHITVSRDITRRKQGEAERREMEQKAHLASRLASVGEMASGIAHEINNPLTSVIGFSQLLMEGDIPADIKEDVSIIHKEAQRAAGVAKNLLTFARKHAPTKQPTNMNSIIDGVLKLRAYEQKVSNIQVDSQLAPDLPEVMADYSQLQQVFINIIINAEAAMIDANKGGTLTITTQRINNTVRASFSDDGPGITRENLNRIFDPFFTTKEVGKGTGLGLSVCHGIIAEHGGRMYARSKLGKGATFVVELPANSS